MTTRNRVTIDDLLGMLKGGKKTSRGHMAFCPAHDDGQSHNYKGGQSLEVWDKDGFVKVKCYAGCPTDSILAALHLSKDDLVHGSQKSAKPNKASRTIVATYDYLDGGGRLLFQVVRFKPKGFSQRRPDGPGDWIWNLKGITPVLYHLPELKAAIAAGQTIYIVEGEQDADAARLLGLAATTSPMGAGKWHGEYTETLKGAAQLVLIPDNDEPGRCHMADIAAALHAQGTPVKLLEPLGKGKGYDLSDWQAGGGRVEDMEANVAAAPLYEPDKSDTLKELSEGIYCTKDGRLCWNKWEREGEVSIPMCNFSARVSEDIIKDNGVDQSRYFTVTGMTSDGHHLATSEVPAASYNSLGWLKGAWGVRPIIAAGQNTKDRLREAMDYLSQGAQERHIYTHTGWCHINGQDIYLSKGGAIGCDNVDVELDQQLEKYSLPQPDAEKAVAAVKASVDFLYTTDLSVSLPLWAAMYMAPLGGAIDTAFSLWLKGPSGCFKSTLAGLALSHFGDFDQNNLPAAWNSTANKLMDLLFLAKDIPLVIDDWAPGQDTSKQRDYESMAEKVIRAQANRQGRGRMSRDSSSQSYHPPRGFLVITGEHLLSGHSANARVFVVPMEEKMVDLSLLTRSQREARQGLYRQAMAQYIDWLQPTWMQRKLEIRRQFSEMRMELSAEARERDIHPRLPDMMAMLCIGLNMGLDHAVHRGAVRESDVELFRVDGKRHIMEMAEAQGGRVQEERPGQRAIEAIQAAIRMGTAFLRNKADTQLTPPGPQQVAIGWRDHQNGHVLLDPDAAYQVIVQHYDRAKKPYTISQDETWRDMARLGFAEKGNNGRVKIQVRVTALPRRVRVIKTTSVSLGLADDEPQTEEML